MTKAIESNTQAADTGFSANLELLNSGAEETDELQVNDISTGFLYYDASQPAYHVVAEIVERVALGEDSRLREKTKRNNAYTRHHVTARSLLTGRRVAHRRILT